MKSSYYITEIYPEGTVAVDDMILVKGCPATAGSRILEGFVPLFSADAVERLEAAGYEITGKAKVGEFGLDLLGETSYYGVETIDGEIVNPAAELIAHGRVSCALCVDLNGAPRRAAAISEIFFIKPGYGTVSRYGIIPCACSGEQIGVAATDAATAKEFLSVIAGHDEKDGTSLPQEHYDYSLDENVSIMRICIIRELLESASDEMKERVNGYALKLRALGAKIETVSVPEVFAAQSAWQILMAAETCNNISRYDGVKFGYRTANYRNIDELYVNSRTEGMQFPAKATVVYGSDVLAKGRYDGCYDKALRIRRLVSEKMKELFSSFDAALAPPCGKTGYTPYDITDVFDKTFEESVFTAVPSITGMPAVSTGGVQLMSDFYKESTLLSIAHIVEIVEA